MCKYMPTHIYTIYVCIYMYIRNFPKYPTPKQKKRTAVELPSHQQIPPPQL